MTLEYLVDTNVASEPLRVQPNAPVVERLRVHLDSIALASPVLHELVYGVLRLAVSRRRTEIENYIAGLIEDGMPVLPYDQAAAAWHAAERARLVRAGLTPPFIDGQIAAIAATTGLTLVTFNRADFQHFQGLQVADWRG